MGIYPEYCQKSFKSSITHHLALHFRNSSKLFELKLIKENSDEITLNPKEKVNNCTSSQSVM